MSDSGFAPRREVPQKLMDFIPLCVPEIRGNEWKYIKECLDTNWVSSAGPFVDCFEQVVAAYVGARYAVATVNGTAALHTALLVAGVKPEDEVLVSTLTFIAPVNAIRYCGAVPVLFDAEPHYWQMDSQKVVDFLNKQCVWKNGNLHNRQTGRRVRAILPVHILGHPVDMDPILEAACRYELAVVEDATESLGARHKGERVGHLGDLACFSFNGNKLITTGGGGMIVTDNEVWARKARYLTTQAKDDPQESVHNEIGYNYRLTNIQAALGVAQMEQLEPYLETKRRTARFYNTRLAGAPGIITPQEAPWAESSHWMYTVLVQPEKCGTDSRGLMQALQALGIETRPLWRPVHQQAPYADSQACGGEVAEKLHAQALSLPCSVGIRPDELERVATAVQEGLKHRQGALVNN